MEAGLPSAGRILQVELPLLVKEVGRIQTVRSYAGKVSILFPEFMEKPMVYRSVRTLFSARMTDFNVPGSSLATNLRPKVSLLLTGSCRCGCLSFSCLDMY